MARDRLFISAVSSEFERARDQLAASLRAREMDIAVQSGFCQHDDTTLHELHDYIRDCQAVVCVIGSRSGAMPTAAEALPYVHMLPAGFSEASYTQWELFFARHYRRHLLRYLLKNDKWEADRAAPAHERPDLQAAFVHWLEHAQGQDRGEFDTVDQLCHLVLRENWPPARPEPVVHLPQQVTRAALDEATASVRLTEALRWVNAAFTGNPQDWRNWARLDPLAPHAEAVTQTADGAGVAVPTSRLMKQVGLLFNEKALHARAEPLYRRALTLDEAVCGPDHINVGQACAHLGELLLVTGQFSEAEPLLRRALIIAEANPGRGLANVAAALNNLALLLRATNQLGDAESLLRRALAMGEASLGSNHPNVARNLSNLARLLQDTNRLGEEEPLMRRALATDEASLGKDHPDVARDLNNLAQLLRFTNRLGEAERLVCRALAITEASLGKDHPTVATDLNNLAMLLQGTNRLSEAEPLMRRALAIVLAFQRDTGHAHPHRDVAIENYEALLATLGKSVAEIAAALATLRRQARLDPG